MAPRDPRRESHFPAIEKKYGERISHWLKVMGKVEGKRYPEQIAFLQENYGFSKTHANALVMYTRGSLSSSRHESVAGYYKTIDANQAKVLRKIFKVIKEKHPKLELLIAWNQPMVRMGSKYIFGAGVAKNHILLNPFSKEVLEQVMIKYPDYKVNKHTIQVPNHWQVDQQMILRLVKARIAEK